jgi:hypothetical protein
MIVEKALGQGVLGFRAPALSTCDNLFHALEREKFLYDSSRCLQEAGWDILNDRPAVPRRITRERFERLQYPGSLRTLPLTTDYTWYLKREKLRMALDLAKHDVDACIESGIPFVPVCHVSPIQEGDDDVGFELYKRLVDHAHKRVGEQKRELRMLTLSNAVQEYPWAEAAPN